MRRCVLLNTEVPTTWNGTASCLFVNTDMEVLVKWVQIPTEVGLIFLSFYLNVLLIVLHFVGMQENFQGAKDCKPFPEIWAEAKPKIY